MPGKHAEDAFPDTPDTPPPTFSSTGGPPIPVSATGPNLTDYMAARIHPVLGINQQTPMLQYDVSYPPTTIKFNMSTIPPHVLEELATTPPVPSMLIRVLHLPWTIKILPTSTEYVTVGDVFDAIYRSLRIMVVAAEYERLPSGEARRAVSNAYFRRYERIDDSEPRNLERSKGVKHVDFLGERTMFTGLSSTMEGPQVWLLNLS